MLSFLVPGYLVAAAAAVAALVASHFIVRRHPRALVFPTARFVPQAPVMTTGWARRPADLPLLALRSLCVALAGVGLAGPVIRGATGGTARVILADRSRAVADSAEVSDSVAALRRSGDTVIEFAARVFAPDGGAHSAGEGARTRGSLSAALVAATRTASSYRDRADSVELVIVSPFAAEEIDAATESVRRQWPGRARLVAVAASAAPEPAHSPAVAGGEADDPLQVALALARPRLPSETRIVRAALDAADSAWVAGASGRLLVHWPVADAPSGFAARTAAAPTGSLTTGSGTVLASFQRHWLYERARGGTPVAFWSDGDVAAAEAPHGSGCIRSIAVPVPPVGDLVLRADFHATVRSLLAPCGGAFAFARATGPTLEMLAGPERLAAAAAFAPVAAEASPASKWLLLAALALALLEIPARRRIRQPANEADGAHDTAAVGKAA